MKLDCRAADADVLPLKPRWRRLFGRSRGSRTFQALLPDRPTLLHAAVEPHALEIASLDDGRFELTVIDSEQECSHGYVFADIESAQRTALTLTGTDWIVWCDLRGTER